MSLIKLLIRVLDRGLYCIGKDGYLVDVGWFRSFKKSIKRFLRRTCEVFGYDRFAYPALNNLDKNILRYLPDKPGIFIEAGANNGYSQSNTYYLERFKGWKGILIEPIPELYRECVKERKMADVFNCALVSEDYEMDFLEIHSASLMSVVNGIRADEKRHLSQAAQFEKGLKIELIKVPTRTLTSIVEECKIEKIDLLSLDVEGYEIEVLKGLDFDRFAPDLILVEANKRNELHAFLSNRYDLINEFSEKDILYKIKIE